MPFDWVPDIGPDKPLAFNLLKPARILYEIDDEPLLFITSTTRGLQILCYKTDDSESRSQYLVAPTNKSIVDNLSNGNISLRSAMMQPWLWIAETANTEFNVVMTWTTNPDTLPETILPKAGRSLYNSRSFILERTIVREKDAYLSVKFRGGNIKNGTIPFGVIKSSLDDVYRSIWGLFAPGIQRATRNVHDKTLRKIVNIPTYEMAHASLLIEIEKPEIDLSIMKSINPPDINIEDALANIDSAHKEFLNATQVIRETLQGNNLTQGLADDNFGALEAVAPIVPRHNSFFEALEINGRHPDRTIRPLVINAAQGEAIRKIYEGARSALRTIDGEIFLVNAHSYQFTLATGAKNVTCVATTDEQRSRIKTLQNGERARVRGYVTPRVQRDLMEIQTLTVDGLTTA